MYLEAGHGCSTELEREDNCLELEVVADLHMKDNRKLEEVELHIEDSPKVTTAGDYGKDMDRLCSLHKQVVMVRHRFWKAALSLQNRGKRAKEKLLEGKQDLLKPSLLALCCRKLYGGLNEGTGTDSL